MATKNQAIVNIAKNWKLEAKLEDNLKYFYHYKEVNMILSNQKCYVIGRKGAGKSAICEYIVKNRSFDSFAIKLNFKNLEETGTPKQLKDYLDDFKNQNTIIKALRIMLLIE